MWEINKNKQRCYPLKLKTIINCLIIDYSVVTLCSLFSVSGILIIMVNCVHHLSLTAIKDEAILFKPF